MSKVKRGILKAYHSISVPLYQCVIAASHLEMYIVLFLKISRREGPNHLSAAVPSFSKVPPLYTRLRQMESIGTRTLLMRLKFKTSFMGTFLIKP